MAPKSTASDTIEVYFSCINSPVGVGLPGGWTALLHAVVQGPSFPILGLRHPLGPCRHPGWRNDRAARLLGLPKPWHTALCSHPFGETSVTWPHLPARQMGNEAWLCAREKRSTDLVRQLAVSTREGVVSHPGEICQSPTHLSASVIACSRCAKHCARCWQSRKE